MTFDEFQELSLRTTNDLLWPTALAVASLGLVCEAGEAGDHVKKHLGQGVDLNEDAVIEEIGDTLFYAAWLSNLLGRNLSEVALGNVEKLAARYPDGFDSAVSQARYAPLPDPPGRSFLAGRSARNSGAQDV